MLKPGSYFSEQTRDEKVVIFVRRHWLSFFNWMLIICIMFFIPPIIFYSNQSDLLTSIRSSYVSMSYIIIGISCYYLFVLALFTTAWMNYYLDVSIVTTNHLIDIRQFGLFNRKVAEQSLLRVQDVSSRMKGFLQTLARYGEVYVETAGDAPNFEMRDIPRPHRIANAIMGLHEELVKSSQYVPELAVAEGEFKKQPGAINENIIPPADKVKKTPEKTEIKIIKIPQKINDDNEEKPKEATEKLIDLVDKLEINNNPVDKHNANKEGELKEGETISLD